MLATLAKSIFGSSNDRYVAKLGKIVETINGYEPTISAMTEDELRGQTAVFRQRLAEGAKLDEPTRQELLESVRDEAERLNRLVQNLLPQTGHAVRVGITGAARDLQRRA